MLFNRTRNCKGAASTPLRLITMKHSCERAKEIRLGMVGLGHVSEWQIQAIPSVEGIRAVACTDLEPGRADRKSGLKFFRSMPELLHSGVDAILVSTPPKAHFEVAKEALEAGMHVLLEKPATLCLSELDSLYSLARRADRLVIVAFHAAFARDLVWTQQALRTEPLSRLGPIRTIRSQFFDPYLGLEGVSSSHQSLGGSWFDSGINALSVIHSIVGNLELEEARLTTISCVSDVDVAANTDWTARDPVHGSSVWIGIETNWTLGLNRKTTLVTFDGGVSLLLDHSGQRVMLRKLGGPTTELKSYDGSKPRLVNHYIGVFEDFVRRVGAGESNEPFVRATHESLFEALSKGVSRVL